MPLLHAVDLLPYAGARPRAARARSFARPSYVSTQATVAASLLHGEWPQCRDPLIRCGGTSGENTMRTRRQISARAWTLILFAFVLVLAFGNAPMSATRIEPPRAAVSLRSENAAAASTIDQARALNNYGKLPVAFIENMGQTDARVRYYALGNRFAFYLTQQEVVLAFANRSADSGVALGLRFVGANPHPRIEGVARAPGEVNFLQ